MCAQRHTLPPPAPRRAPIQRGREKKRANYTCYVTVNQCVYAKKKEKNFRLEQEQNGLDTTRQSSTTQGQQKGTTELDDKTKQQGYDKRPHNVLPPRLTRNETKCKRRIEMRDESTKSLETPNESRRLKTRRSTTGKTEPRETRNNQSARAR